MFDQHMARLEKGTAALGISMPFARETLRAALRDLTSANGIIGGVARITMTRGAGTRGLVPGPNLCPTAVISASSGIPYDETLYTQGLRAIVLPWPRNERSPLVGIKSLNFLENVMGAMLAKRHGAHEGLFLNTVGRLAEGASSNLFLSRDGTLMTPSMESGLLPGIVRECLISGGNTIETTLSVEDLYQADEVFLTNSVLEVAPLVEVDGRKIGDGRPGPMASKIREWYKSLVGTA